MKFVALISAFVILLLTQTCENSLEKKSDTEIATVEISGVVEPLQMSSWQYGTHTISADTTFYAIKSNDVDLKNYEGKTVTVRATKIEGYPVDGGPEFLEVIEVKK